MKLLLVKALGCLKPATLEADNAIKAIPLGELTEVDLKRIRNPKPHRLFFALLDTIFTNLPESMHRYFPTSEVLRQFLLVRSGNCDVHRTPTGEVFTIPHSMAWDAMDEEEFSKVFRDCMAVVREDVLPGITDEELRRAVDAEVVSSA